MRAAGYLVVGILASATAPSRVIGQASASQTVDVRLDVSEASAALGVLASIEERGEVPAALWRALFESAGYRRLQVRDRSFGHSADTAGFRRFLELPETVRRRAGLDSTLRAWASRDVAVPTARALAYLPAGARIVATVYPVIKPRSNSFVFEAKSDSAAIFLYLDPAVSAEAYANTLAHELHHVGLAQSCPDVESRDRQRDALLEWLGAFGEGIAMLAAAGEAGVHPHASSDPATRARWDRDIANAGRDLPEVEAFLTEVVGGRLGREETQTRGMAFFGVQGPWYTLGYLMAAAIERRDGRSRLVSRLCDPTALLLDYESVAADTVGLPRWSSAFLDGLAGRGH